MSDDNQKDSGAGKKGAGQNVLLVVIIAVLCTLLVAGGIIAALLMRSNSHKEEAAAEPAAAETAKDSPAKGKDKERKGDKGPAIYIAMEPPFVVNFETTQTARFLQVNVQLMTRDSSTAQLLRDNEPILRNDLLFLLSSQTYETVSTASGKEELRKRALETVRAVVKQEGGKPELFENVYFTSFVMQ
jgi:flagellar protein FliL